MTETFTVIVGTLNDGWKIATFDWKTMLYQELPVKWKRNRSMCSCGLLKNKNGQKVIAAAGENLDDIYVFVDPSYHCPP